MSGIFVSDLKMIDEFSKLPQIASAVGHPRFDFVKMHFVDYKHLSHSERTERFIKHQERVNKYIAMKRRKCVGIMKEYDPACHHDVYTFWLEKLNIHGVADMAHHKRKRPKNRRSGCLLCKPWKANGCKHKARKYVLKANDQAKEMICEAIH